MPQNDIKLKTECSYAYRKIVKSQNSLLTKFNAKNENTHNSVFVPNLVSNSFLEIIQFVVHHFLYVVVVVFLDVVLIIRGVSNVGSVVGRCFFFCYAL